MNAKIIAFGAVTVALAFVFGYSFSAFTVGAGYLYLLIAAILAIFFLVFFSLQTLFIRNGVAISVLIFLEATAMTSPFLRKPSSWLWLIGFGVFLLLSLAHHVGRRRLSNNLKINFSELRRHMLPIASTVIILFMVAGYIAILGQQPLSVSRQTVSWAIRPLAPIIKKFIPDFSPKNSVGGLLESVAKRSYGNQLDSKGAALQLKEVINQFLDVKLNLDENIVDGVQKMINASLLSAPEQVKGKILLFLALALFLIISGGTFFINLIVAFLTWLIYKMLLYSRFIYITLNNVKQEEINI